MNEELAEACQDELTIREKIAQLLAMRHPYGYDSFGQAVNWYGLSEQGQTEVLKDADQILSQTVSSGKTLAKCIKEATKDGKEKRM